MDDARNLQYGIGFDTIWEIICSFMMLVHMVFLWDIIIMVNYVLQNCF